MKELPETHQVGFITMENFPIHSDFITNHKLKGDLGIQIAKDGRIWICINGIAFLRFHPERRKDKASPE